MPKKLWSAPAWLSVALLLGLGLNYWTGLWQAAPIVGLVIVGFLLKEGWETWEGEEE
jgi:divalent metal cation (Fe/Co/Zn/Cd) transporter